MKTHGQVKLGDIRPRKVQCNTVRFLRWLITNASKTTSGVGTAVGNPAPIAAASLTKYRTARPGPGQARLDRHAYG